MNKILSFLGLARRSGSLILGGNLVESAIKRKKVKLLIIATDASGNTMDKFTSYAKANNIDVLNIATKEELGLAVGKGDISVIGVTDINITLKLKELKCMN